MFLGHAVSGHSLVGALLDAHPEIVMAHEEDILRYVRYCTRGQLFQLLLDNTRRHAGHGRKWGRFTYEVEGQWQGRYRRIRVIGDKKGGATTEILTAKPELLDLVRARVGVPLRVLVVLRNPFDNIASHVQKSGWQIDAIIDDYFRRTRMIGEILGRLAPGEAIVVRYEDFTSNVSDRLKAICAELGVAAEEPYLEACRRLAYSNPRRSRLELDWTQPQLARIQGEIDRLDLLQGFTFAA